jgi:hypothetical protein
VVATLGGQINDSLVLSAMAYYDWVDVQGQKLGDGIGMEVALDYIFQQETLNRPELTVGYFGEYRKFNHASSVPTSVQREVRRAITPDEADTNDLITGDTTSDILNTLVDPETNQHGFVFKISKRLNDHVNLYGNAGAYYGFDQASLEFFGAGGLEYWINDANMLFTELRYDTSGRGASTQIGVFQANVGGMFSF